MGASQRVAAAAELRGLMKVDEGFAVDFHGRGEVGFYCDVFK